MTTNDHPEFPTLEPHELLPWVLREISVPMRPTQWIDLPNTAAITGVHANSDGELSLAYMVDQADATMARRPLYMLASGSQMPKDSYCIGQVHIMTGALTLFVLVGYLHPHQHASTSSSNASSGDSIGH